ncbi:response regulator transcription factor [Vibrio genomosp. F10 str. 9ZC157]|uniref:response regulator transcription factor n=1 Tax=Vibrio genomosp. F10 TaxID=723171 RepID=UPI0002E6F927|nr:response regulator transcription factor [Vibrio genomosp. F10]OEE93795.1 DNA-binding response regulator [Vibrio genomosp. F10 str. 9ZC157]
MDLSHTHVLIVEDDKRLSRMMSDMLKAESYQVSCVYDGLQAIQQINQVIPDIVLLDMMLPGCDGLQVLKEISPDFLGIIIMITAKKDEFLEVSALNLGVHDYITKPLRPHILSARLRALSRLNHNHVQTVSDKNLLKVQDLTLNVNSREFCLANESLQLSAAELEIMSYFMHHPGVVLNRDMLVSEVRNLEYDGFDRSIDMRISSLRRKLKDSQPPYKYIKTVRAKGYILVQE